jgi:hypothetical protein
MPFFKRYLPIISFVIGVSALSFQTLVLYPWHNQLDDEFKSLKQLKSAQDQDLKNYNSQKLGRIVDLESKID